MYQRDAPAGGVPFIGELGVGWAMGQTQTALDALVGQFKELGWSHGAGIGRLGTRTGTSTEVPDGVMGAGEPTDVSISTW